MAEFEYIERNVAQVTARIEKVARRVGVRPPTLVAVTKSGTLEEVLALSKCVGVTDMAENRVQQFCERQEAVCAMGYCPAFHLIGSLQTNKVKYIVGKTTLIQSLDSLRLAEEIEKQAQKREICVDCLVEINSGREDAKGGLLPENAAEFLDAVTQFSHIRVRGLMTMAPMSPFAEDARPYFRLTRSLYERFSGEGRFGSAPILSMGMSGSFEVAIEEGATMVRVGRALFNSH